MRVVLIVSWVALLWGVALPVVYRLEGKKGGGWFVVPLLAGIIGISVYKMLDSMDSRVSALEGQQRSTRPTNGTEGGTQI